MEALIDHFCKFMADSLHPFQVLNPGTSQLLQTTKLLQQALATLRPDTIDLLQDRAFPPLVPSLAMPGNGKPVCFIPNLLYQVHGR